MTIRAICSGCGQIGRKKHLTFETKVLQAGDRSAIWLKLQYILRSPNSLLWVPRSNHKLEVLWQTYSTQKECSSDGSLFPTSIAFRAKVIINQLCFYGFVKTLIVFFIYAPVIINGYQTKFAAMYFWGMG